MCLPLAWLLHFSISTRGFLGKVPRTSIWLSHYQHIEMIHEIPVGYQQRHEKCVRNMKKSTSENIQRKNPFQVIRLIGNLFCLGNKSFA